MDILSFKQISELQEEISRLRNELKSVNDANSQKLQMMITVEGWLEQLKTKNHELEERILTLERENAVLIAENVRLAETVRVIESVKNPMSKTRNERNAGRKPKANPEQARYILSLHEGGKGYGTIADILSKETGEVWNKATVRNIILRSNN